MIWGTGRHLVGVRDGRMRDSTGLTGRTCQRRGVYPHRIRHRATPCG
ncbi:hypothetical protein L842_6128 [Mycobacterium intracellulare MIN_052511_1280]|nr:hypothetical protein L842_6128 [Mycobacterium intracellulare MIN_052511_1280]